LVVVTHDPLLSTSTTLALRSVRSIGSLRPDGAPRAFVATAPGQPVLATVDLKKRTRYVLRATADRLPSGWAGRIAPSSPSGCIYSGQSGYRTQVGYVDAEERASATFRRGSNLNPWLVLMDPGDGATGRVTLAVTSTPAPVP
jgi:hypothetical protein